MSLINPYTCSDRDYELAVERHYERMFDDFYSDRKTVEPDDPCFDELFMEDDGEYDE